MSDAAVCLFLGLQGWRWFQTGSRSPWTCRAGRRGRRTSSLLTRTWLSGPWRKIRRKSATGGGRDVGRPAGRGEGGGVTLVVAGRRSGAEDSAREEDGRGEGGRLV